MNTIVFMFPGQGSQKAGMLKDIHTNYPIVRQTFAEASEVLGYSMEQLCFEDPESQLNLTAFTQPALLTCSTALFRLLADAEIVPSQPIFAGHSLGEYSALVAAGVLPFADALRLVRLRGEAMQSAVPIGIGAMAALLGNFLGPDADSSSIDALCVACSTEMESVSVANENSLSQLVVSGHRPAVDRLIERFKELKMGRAMLLPVSAPFHSPLMKPAAEKVSEALTRVALNPGTGLVCANVDAQLYPAESYKKELLVQQIEGRVRWTQSLLNVQSKFQDQNLLFLEVGPGSVLQGLVRKTLDSHFSTKGADSLEQLKELGV
jgi:[acyl-carrier-protein] S-malonyltransferase